MAGGRGGGVTDTRYVARDVNTLYTAARERLDAGDYQVAAGLFDEVERQHRQCGGGCARDDPAVQDHQKSRSAGPDSVTVAVEQGRPVRSSTADDGVQVMAPGWPEV